jgi:hypothetical protein
MTRSDHLLVIAAEECNEIAQRISKALRFGFNEVQPGQELDNAERIRREVVDLAAVLYMIEDESGMDLTTIDAGEIGAKQVKVEAFLELSDECGRLDD